MTSPLLRLSSFLVAGRAGVDGAFIDAANLTIPLGFENLFKSIPAVRFRLDISSTELMATGQRYGH